MVKNRVMGGDLKGRGKRADCNEAGSDARDSADRRTGGGPCDADAHTDNDNDNVMTDTDTDTDSQ